MKNVLAGFRKAGSFIAGLLIGFSIVAFAFAMMMVDPSDWDALWVLGAPVLLALGIALQVVVTTSPRAPAHAESETWTRTHWLHGIEL